LINFTEKRLFPHCAIDEKTAILTINFEKIDLLFQNSILKYLPPIKLKLSVSESTNYPDEDCLDIRFLDSSFLEKSEITELLDELKELFIPGMGVIFDLHSHISSLDLVEKYFSSEKDQTRAIKYERMDRFINYNDTRLLQNFETSEFTCGVCFTDFLGKNCLYNKACSSHVYCKSCARQYFKTKIADRSVSISQSIPKCMDPSCDKTSAHTVAMIQDLVGNETFAKYNEILTESLLNSENESMGSRVFYCPRKSCQSPISIENYDQRMKDDPSLVNCISCGHCPYVYCGLCQSASHRPPCALKKGELRKILIAHKKKDQKIIKYYESKYQRTFTSLVNEMLSEILVKNISKSCPNCKAKTTKIEGCNKMTCNFCGTFWCWLCETNLRAYGDNPYRHYNPYFSDGPCANQLFEGIDQKTGEGFGDIDIDSPMVLDELIEKCAT